MKVKKIPLRTCVLTKEKLDKKELLRIVKTKEGNIFVDKTLKANGRGVYLKKTPEVIKKAETLKILDRVLEANVPHNIYEELLNLVGSDYNE